MRSQTADELWHALLAELSNEPVQSGVCLTLTDHRGGWLWNSKRELSVVAAFGDLLWMLSFNRDGEQAKEYRSRPADRQGVVLNAIGPRLRNQLSCAIASLAKDRETDGAVLCPWRGLEAQHDDFIHGDIPFLRPSNLLTAQFTFSEEKLNLVASYRNADAWNVPYDIFAASRLLSMVAGDQGLEPGSTTLILNRVSLADPKIAEAVLSDAPQVAAPLLIDDSRGQREGAGLLAACEDAAVVEELTRRGIAFKENTRDLGRFVPLSTLRGALAACHISHAAKRMRVAPSFSERFCLPFQAATLLTDCSLDKRLAALAVVESQERYPATGVLPRRRA